MAQKSILSFFKKTPAKVSVPATKTSDSEPGDTQSDSDDVLSKSISTSKKRRRIISSSAEEESPKKNENNSVAAKGKKSRPSDSPDVKRAASPVKKEKLTPDKLPAEVSPKSSDTNKRSAKGVKESPSSKTDNSPGATKNKNTTVASKRKTTAKNSVKDAKTEESTDIGEPSKEADEETKDKPSSPPTTNMKCKNSVEDKKETISPKSTKGINNFFTTTKDLKVQSAGEGHDGADYNPAKSKYHPIDDAFWKLGEAVPYLALTKTFEQIEEISGRLRMIEVLANFFRSVIVLSPDDLVACVYLCQNQLAPAYEGLELGIAETSLMKVIAQTTGRSLAHIKTDAKNSGDLGLVAEQSKSNQRMMFVPAPLTVKGVFSKIKDISKMTGSSAVNKKVDKIQAIFVACRHSEAKFFIRSLLGKLRIGLAEQSVLQAISLACALTPPNQKESPPKILTAVKGEATVKSRVEEVALQIKTTYCQCPNFDKIIAVLLADGVEALLDKCQMTPSVPLKPMLAHPTKGIQEVLQRLDGIKFTCEYKYDGERAQIHIADDGSVSIYSRNQENNTSKYPDIIGRIGSMKGPEVKSCILDCEAVAWDTDKKQILPFQILSTRKRKDAVEDDIKVKVCVFMFDCLYLNGEPLVTKPFIERRRLLMEHFVAIEGEWQFARSLDTSDLDELQQFLELSIKENCEGLMVKTLERNATYEIAKRSRNWLKIKKDYLSGVGDSLDLVVIGGYQGRGKRAGTFGGFLLACYDSENEQYQSICKIGTGFSDDDLQKHSEFLRKNVIKEPKSYYCYDVSHKPDEWFDPVQVWEVLCADLSLSPVHKAAMGIIDPEKGISLRFPRFIRIRDDKSVEDATSAQQVAEMYSNQDQIKNQDKSNKDFEEDFY